MKKKITAILTLCVLVLGSSMPVAQVQAKPVGKTVIVIDPGHGGASLGGEPGAYYEKDIDLKTADAMRAELEKYENVTVYMTRTENVDVSLADRAKLAKEVKADFFISLHYNMSESHAFYGAEVWTQSIGTNYAKGQTLGNVLLQELQTVHRGLYNKGTKVRTEEGGADYYGVLRESAKSGIPAVIVEHCYMDHPNDSGFCDEDSDYEKFGRADATATAKYFGLKSGLLGVDYSKSVPEQISIPRKLMRQDETPPETVSAQIAHVDNTGNRLGVALQLWDSESAILYYSYSLDGGLTWSALQKWGISQTAHTVEIPLQPSPNRTLLVRAYNEYHFMTESSPTAY